jgi:hypothetical protein
MQSRSFRKTFDSGFYFEWEQPKGMLRSLYIHGESSISGRICYDPEDYKVFREGWKVQESEIDLKGCKFEVLDDKEIPLTYEAGQLPDELRDYVADEMIHIVEGEA